MRVDLRGSDIFVAEKLLNRAEIRALLKQISRVRMPERMGSGEQGYTGLDSISFDDSLHRTRSKTILFLAAASKIYKKSLLIVATGLEILFHPLQRTVGKIHGARPRSFANDTEFEVPKALSAVEGFPHNAVELFFVERDEFRDTQTS